MPHASYPKVALGFFPTPIVELPNLTKKLGGPQLYMKRDDNTGLGLGGNKTRKLEYIMADALHKGADTIVTAGSVQSNHCRQTAAAAASLNLECHLMLGGMETGKLNGNLLLDKLFGCHIHWERKHRKGETIPHLMEVLKQEGKKPYFIDYGGSNELGALAFVKATKEMHIQSKEMGVDFTHVVFASSSGGTHAGLLLGKRVFKGNYELLGINIDKLEDDETELNRHIADLANSTAKLASIDHVFSENDVHLNPDYTGEGYAILGEREKEAINLVAQSEGILLGPVYTGRAMGGLIDLIRTGQIDSDAKVLFWHTGGAPALFAYADELLA